MRHVIGIALAIGLAAAVFFAAGWGYLKLLRNPVVSGASDLPAAGGGLLHDTTVLYGFAALAGTALLAGILVAAPRISPLAAGLPGLALVALTVLYGLNVGRAVRYIPLRGDAFGAGFEMMLMNGVLAVVGVALVVPLFVPSRWRSRTRLPVASGWGAAPVQPPSSNISLLADDWTDTAPYPTNDQYGN